MAVEIEIRTFAMKSIKLPLFTGYIARGLILHILRLVNPSISQNMHEPNAVKPYSVTPLYFRSSKKLRDGYVIDISNPCIFKIRLLDDSLARDVVTFLTSHKQLMNRWLRCICVLMAR